MDKFFTTGACSELATPNTAAFYLLYASFSLLKMI
jgi:hypothetical protein